MSNEVDKKVIVSDDELKQVTGGAAATILMDCGSYSDEISCANNSACEWSNGVCNNITILKK